MRNSRLYDLEYRFENTGRDGVMYLNDKELKELEGLYEEMISYFQLSKNSIVEFYFQIKVQAVKSCLFARKAY